MNHSAPIQQQIYTRERRGIFRQTEGFDTVAKSAGLEPSFVKKVLHPFCFYDAPAELTARGEKDNAAYPEAIHLFHTENGDTVLGRSLFQSADFTGLRSAFFSHNYVIPSSRLEEIVRDYHSFLHADFMRSYDIEQGEQLEVLNQLPVVPMAPEVAEAMENPYQLLKELRISEQMFKQLLSAVISAATSGRKVYVSPDVPAALISEAALPLLEILYSALPHPLRRVLGFLTYTKEPQSRKGIHISFVERGSLRVGDRGIEKDYTFDLASGRVTHVDLDWAKQPFLDLVWELLGRREQLEDFHRFADIMLKDMGQEKAMSISSYHELSVLYQIEGGNEGLYESHKVSVLNGMLEYLRPEGALRNKERLNDLFLARFDREFDEVKSGHVPDLAVAECMKDYYRIDPRNNERRIVEYFIRAAANARREPGIFAKLNALLENHPSLRKAYFDQVLSDGQLTSLLFEPYIRERFEAVANAREVVSLVQEWDRYYPGLWEESSLQELARSEMNGKLVNEREIIRAVNDVLGMLGSAVQTGGSQAEAAGRHQEWREQKRQMQIRVDEDSMTGKNGGEDAWNRLAEPSLRQEGRADRRGGISAVLAEAARRVLLTLLDLDALTKDNLLSLEFLKWADKDSFGPQRLDTQAKSKLAVLKSLYAWFSEPEPDVHVFDKLTPQDMDEAQRVGRRWLRGELSSGRYDRLTLAFYRGGADDAMDYASLVDSLRTNAGQPGTIYRFFQWSERQPLYLRGSKFTPAYEAAILAYFRKHDRDAFKKRANWKEHFDKAGRVLKPVYVRAGQELASPLARMFRGRKTIFFSLIVLLLAAGVWGTLQLTGTFDKKDPVAVAPKLPDKPVQPVPVDPVPVLPERAVYAEQVKGKNGKEATRLVFLFQSAEECQAFKSKSVSIVDQKGNKENLTLSKLTHSCAEDTASEGTNSGKETGSAHTEDNKGAGTDAGTGNGTNDSGKNKDVNEDKADSNSKDQQPAGTDNSSEKDSTSPTSTTITTTTTGDSSSSGGQSSQGTAAGKEQQDGTVKTEPVKVDPKAYKHQVTAMLGKAYGIPAGSKISSAKLDFEFVTKDTD